MNIYTFIMVFLLLLFLRFPIGVVMLASSVLYFISHDSPFLILSVPEKIMDQIDEFVLMAIPFFMLAGEIMNRAKLTDKLFTFANMLFGRFRGGLAQVNIFASILFSGVTGVALGDIASLGKMFVPAMVRQGYPLGFSSAVTAASSLVGAIIPPSTIIILYCSVVPQASVGAMFAAAIIPGILIGVSQMILVQIQAYLFKFPKVEVEVTPKKLGKGFLDASLAIIMPIIIIRSIAAGWVTPTEAAATAVFYTLFVGMVVFRTIKKKDLVKIFMQSSLDTAKLFFIIAGVGAVSAVFAWEQVPQTVDGIFDSLNLSPIMMVLLVNLFFIFCGMWLDPGIAVILFAPIFAPIMVKMGMHEVQFGIMLIVNCVVGLCTPPVGNILFAVSSVTGVSIGALSKALLPFLILGFINVLMLGFIDELTLFIPRYLGLI